MVFFMIFLGGITRITGSGLSIVDWKPLMGVFPPIGKSEWKQVFDCYQRSPEYQQITIGISITEFKRLFWIEFLHRFLGRIIALVYLGLILYVGYFKELRKSFFTPLIILWILGGFQGIIGWFVVKSGLANIPHVSPYLLVLHLFLGCSIYGGTLWLAFKAKLSLSLKELSTQTLSLLWLFNLLFILVLLTMLYGGLVSAHKAGLIYNTFPLMEKSILPQDALSLSPTIINFWANPVMIQFIHRILAILTLLWVTTLVFIRLLTRRQEKKLLPLISRSLVILGILSPVQIILGIFTLVYKTHPVLASLHQIVALLIFSKSLFLLWLANQEKECLKKLHLRKSLKKKFI